MIKISQLVLVDDLNQTLETLFLSFLGGKLKGCIGDYEAPGDDPAGEGKVDELHGAGYA